MKTLMHPDYWVEIPAGEFLVGLSVEQKQIIRTQIRKQVGYDNFSTQEQQLVDGFIEKIQLKQSLNEVERAIRFQEPFETLLDVELAVLGASVRKSIWLDRFYIARFPITREQLTLFVQGTLADQLPPPIEELPNHDLSVSSTVHQKPKKSPFGPSVASIHQDLALRLCQEIGGRLPTDLEWQKAAQGTDGRLYPWGDKWNRKACCFYAGQAPRGVKIDAFPQGVSPYGIWGMAGGIPELVLLVTASHPYVFWRGAYFREASIKMAWFKHMVIWPGQGRQISLRPVLSQWPQQQWIGYQGQEKKNIQNISSTHLVRLDSLPSGFATSKSPSLTVDTITEVTPLSELKVRGDKFRVGSERLIHGLSWSSTGQYVALACSQEMQFYQIDEPSPNISRVGRGKVRFRPHTDILAFLGGSSTINLRDLAKDKIVTNLSIPTKQRITSLVFDPNGTLLGISGSKGLIILWDTKTGEEKIRFQPNNSRVNQITFNSSKQLLASGGNDHTIRLWDINTSLQMTKLSHHTGPVYDVAFSPNGKLLASASADSTVRLWDVETYQEQHVLRDPGGNVAASLSFSPDGQMLAVGYSNGMFKAWSVATGDILISVQCDMGWIINVSFSPNGQWLATYSQDVVLWGIPTEKYSTQ